MEDESEIKFKYENDMAQYYRYRLHNDTQNYIKNQYEDYYYYL